MVSASTKKQYESNLNKLFTVISQTDIKTYKKVIDAIKSISNNKSTIKSYLSAVIYYIKENELKINTEKYSNYIKELSTDINAKREENKLTATERKNFIKWDDIIKLRDSLINKLHDNEYYTFYIILCLYTYLPPRRLLDYIIKVTNKDDDKSNIYDGKVCV